MDAMKRILIVDDEEMIVKTVKAYLDREGFKTYTAADGEAALRAFEEKGPDLIVLDLMLPGVSGIEVTKKIRAQSSVPIIMLTAKAGEAESGRWPGAGCRRLRGEAVQPAGACCTCSCGASPH